MTRFARAKGSKASNERLPEDPTPWHVMKNQLEHPVTTPKKQQKSKSARELLKEKEDSLFYPTLENQKTDWAEFEDTNVKRSKKHEREDFECPPLKKKKKHNEKTDNVEKKEHRNSLENDSSFIIKSNCNSQKLKKNVQIIENVAPTRAKEQTEISKIENNINDITESKKSEPIIDDTKEKSAVKLSKRQKRNRKNRKSLVSNDHSARNDNLLKNKINNDSKSSSGMFNVEGNDWDNSLKFSKSNTLPEDSGVQEKSFDNRNTNSNHNFKADKNNFRNQFNRFDKQKHPYNKIKLMKNRKPPKVRDDKEHKRRKPILGSTKVIINGVEVEITSYDGFPVRKEDAERLTELRKKMVMKGISKSEIDAAMKLERRKSEKALARIRRNACFHCRKAGHNLSDCPELGREEAAIGICFKCGSTEHTHFECKVNKKEQFGFATCFICREQGHIARQCPDNPKGLYPNGGACKICGDVTHLKKDCPDLVKEKEETTITLDTIGRNTIESLSDAKGDHKPEKLSSIKNNIVKF